MTNAILVIAAYDMSSKPLLDGKWGLTIIAIDEIIAVVGSPVQGASAMIQLRTGQVYHCKQEISVISKSLEELGWKVTTVPL